MQTIKPHPVIIRLFEKAQQLPLALWITLMIILPVGVGGFGVWLLGQKESGECEAAKTSPTVPESTRLYCAQLIADRQSPNDYVEAIYLADSVSHHHPLRSNSDRLIERWSNRLLELGDTTYHDGKLTDAIALIQRIPPGSPSYEAVSPRVQKWQDTWKEAETIYDDAQTALQDDKPTVALAEARKLLRVENQYWRTTRFQELVNQIQATRENKQKAAQKQKKSEEKILTTRSLTTDDLLNNWQKEQNTEAIAHLSKAKQLAAGGDSASLRNAISEAELIFSGTGSYAQAQQLIATWSQQIEAIEDRPILDRATRLANKGDLTSLQAAISEANNIYFGRSLYREAQSRIDQWTTQVQQLHDQQYSQQELPPSNQFQPIEYSIPSNPSKQ